MNFLQKLLRRLFPKDGQLRIAVYDDGRAQIQEYFAPAGRWQTYCHDGPLHNGYQFHTSSFSSFHDAKEAYDAIMEDRSKLGKMHSITRTYP